MASVGLRDRRLILAADVARALSSPGDEWTTERARRWLQKSRAGVKRNGRWVTTVTRLRDHFPEALDEILYRGDD